MLRCSVVLLGLFCCSGCYLLPDIAHQPTLHNPFPQLSKVAVAPFFNLSNEPTVDGRQFALAYFNELQLVPGYEVVPVGVVERTMQDHRITLRGPRDARRLAQLLGADAVVVGAITDYSPYYPPRCTMQVEWYAANPGFHPIPPGYGLPWGTPGEQGIPSPLVLQAEMALAKEQLKTQTPAYTPEPPEEVPPGQAAPPSEMMPTRDQPASGSPAATKLRDAAGTGGVQPASLQTAVGPNATNGANRNALAANANGQVAANGIFAAMQTAPWPDPRGFVPLPPSPRPPTCWPSEEPVLRHTQTYNGHDGNFTEALNAYYFFRDDARFGGWQSYLQRSEDFIRFCCHMHLWEMLSARGGAGETRVVWRWPSARYN